MDSAAFGESFLEGLRRTNEENKYGKALELKDLAFYQDARNRLYGSELDVQKVRQLAEDLGTRWDQRPAHARLVQRPSPPWEGERHYHLEHPAPREAARGLQEKAEYKVRKALTAYISDEGSTIDERAIRAFAKATGAKVGLEASVAGLVPGLEVGRSGHLQHPAPRQAAGQQ